MMAMRIGILTTRDQSYHGNARLLQAAREEGHQALLVHPLKCRPCFDAQGKARLEYQGESPLGLDVLIPRIGATIDDFELSVARHLECNDTCLLNTSSAIVLCRDKFWTLQAMAAHGLPVPPTELLHWESAPQQAVQALGGFPLVLKRRRGRKGRGVMLVENASALSFVLEGLRGAGEAVLLQRYIRAEGLRDLRVLVVGNKVWACMAKRPRAGDFRSNIDLTGRGYPVELTSLEKELALRAVRALGLDVGGVDLLSLPGGEKVYVLEVNYTPGLKELERISGRDLARVIIRAAVDKAQSLRKEVP